MTFAWNTVRVSNGVDGKSHLFILFTDIIIVEDDPYYFLQFGKYMPKTERVYNTPHATKDVDEEAAFVASLAPSYLK